MSTPDYDALRRGILELLQAHEKFADFLRGWLAANVPLTDAFDEEELPLPSNLDERTERVWNYLLERRGRILNVREIARECVMSEGMVTTSISLIRKSMGESTKYPRWLVTHRGLGYELRRTPLSRRSNTSGKIQA